MREIAPGRRGEGADWPVAADADDDNLVAVKVEKVRTVYGDEIRKND